MTAEAIRRGYTSSKQAGDGWWKQNCSRDTWRWFNRWGFRWNVKLSTYDYIAPSWRSYHYDLHLTMWLDGVSDWEVPLYSKSVACSAPQKELKIYARFGMGSSYSMRTMKLLKNTPTTCKISSRSLGTATRGVANDVAIQWWYHARQSSDFIQFCRKGRGVQHVSVTLRSPFKTNFQGRMLMTDYLLNRCQFCWIRGRTWRGTASYNILPFSSSRAGYTTHILKCSRRCWRLWRTTSNVFFMKELPLETNISALR